MYRDCTDIEDFIHIGIKLIVDNELNRYTLYSNLMVIFLSYCQSSDMKELVIVKCNLLYDETMAITEKPEGHFDSRFKMSYSKKNKLNNITGLGVRAYGLLYEFDKAIAYFDHNFFESNSEVKLYILVSILFSYQNHEFILKVLNKDKTIKMRKSLVDLKEYIEKNNCLPNYL